MYMIPCPLVRILTITLQGGFGNWPRATQPTSWASADLTLGLAGPSQLPQLLDHLVVSLYWCSLPERFCFISACLLVPVFIGVQQILLISLSACRLSVTGWSTSCSFLSGLVICI